MAFLTMCKECVYCYNKSYNDKDFMYRGICGYYPPTVLKTEYFRGTPSEEDRQPVVDGNTMCAEGIEESNVKVDKEYLLNIDLEKGEEK